MKNNWMTKLAMAFETAMEGGGGGVAVVDSGAGAGDGGAGAGAGAGGGAAKFNPGGLFAGVRHQAAVKPDDKGAAGAGDGDGDKGGAKDPVLKTVDKTAHKPAADGKVHLFNDDTGEEIGTGFDTQEAALAYAKTLEAAGEGAEKKPDAAAAVTGKLSRPLMGRYTTEDEAEQALRRTQDEALRLVDVNKKTLADHQKALETRDAELAAVKAELEEVRTKGVFKELTADELAAMRKENPADYADYLIEKKERERAAVERKASAERDVQARETRRADVRRFSDERDNAMRADKTRYPNYEDRQPIVKELVEMTRENGFSPFTGHRHSAEILYWAAEGIAAHQAKAGGKVVADEAAKAAALKAKTDAEAAAAGGGANGGGGARKPTTDRQKSDQDYKTALRKVGKPVSFRIGT